MNEAEEQLKHFIQLRDSTTDQTTRHRAQDMIDRLSADMPPGLGDRIESLLKAAGIHQTVKALERATGKDCGCAKRKARLNELGQRLADAWREPPPPEAPDPPP